MQISAAGLPLRQAAAQSVPQTVPAPAAASVQDATSAQEAAAQRKLQDARSALATITSLHKDKGESAKAAARQKVQQLKDRLKALQLMFSSDPKRMARMLAQIARELRAAVKAYVAAGGSAADVAGGTTQQPAGAAPSSADGQAASDEDVASPADASPGDATGAEQSSAAATDPQPDEGRDAAAQVSPEVSAYRERLDRHDAGPVPVGDQQDADFKRDARDIARRIKAMLQAAKNEDQNDDAKAAGRAVQAVEDALDAMPGADATATSGTLLSLSA